MGEQLLAVFGVLGLICAALWALRSKGLVHFRTPRPRREPGLEFRVVDRLPLGPQQALHVIRLAGRAIVIATSPGACHAIAEFEWKEIAAGGRFGTSDAI